MTRKTKGWLISALVLIFVGGILFVSALAAMDFNFKRLSTKEFITCSYDVSEDFMNIYADADLADIQIRPSADGHCKVICSGDKTLTYQVSVNDKTLRIQQINSRRWYDYIGIFADHPEIILYVPATEFENITICTDTGDLQMSQLRCSRLQMETDTGDVVLKDIYAAQMSIETNTGDVEFSACDGAEIQIETDTGDVTGTLLTGKLFYCVTDTGDVHVPKSEPYGQCEIETDTGDIQIKIKK